MIYLKDVGAGSTQEGEVYRPIPSFLYYPVIPVAFFIPYLRL